MGEIGVYVGVYLLIETRGMAEGDGWVCPSGHSSMSKGGEFCPYCGAAGMHPVKDMRSPGWYDIEALGRGEELVRLDDGCGPEFMIAVPKNDHDGSTSWGSWGESIGATQFPSEADVSKALVAFVARYSEILAELTRSPYVESVTVSAGIVSYYQEI